MNAVGNGSKKYIYKNNNNQLEGVITTKNKLTETKNKSKHKNSIKTKI